MAATWKGVDLSLGAGSSSGAPASTASSANLQTELTKRTSHVACLLAALFAIVAAAHPFEWLCGGNQHQQLCMGPSGFVATAHPESRFAFHRRFETSPCSSSNASLAYWVNYYGMCTTTGGQEKYAAPTQATVCVALAWIGAVLSLAAGLGGFIPTLPSRISSPLILATLSLATVCLSVAVHTFLDWRVVDHLLAQGEGGMVFLLLRTQDAKSSSSLLFVPSDGVGVEMTCSGSLFLLVLALGIHFFALIALLVTR